MIKSIDFPGKTFASKEELFKALREGAETIIASKSAEIYNSYKKLEGTGMVNDFLLKTNGEACKTGPQMKDNHIYPVINTTNYRDSHKDVHFDGIWNKSAKEQNGRLYYVADHEIKTNTIIAWPTDVNVMVKTVPWSWLGKDYEGTTEALIYEINKDSIVNTEAKRIITEKRPVQNSVRMQYVKIKLAMNSEAKEDIEHKKYYDEKIALIANKEEVEADGYFWGVEEAKIIREGSMVPLGSNDATPIRQKDTEPDPSTQEKIETEEPGKSTPIIEKTIFINPNLF